MPTMLTMPKLSPTMESGTIVKWLKKEGDKISEGDALFEVATDKATVEHNALDDGYLRKILVQENQSVNVNDPLAIITESQDESIEGFAGEKQESKQDEDKAEEQGEESAEKKEPVKSSKASLSEPGFAPAPPLEDYQFEWARNKKPGRILASPLAKKLAKEKGLNLSSIQGTGPGGRVVKKDLDIAIPSAPASFGDKSIPDMKPGSFSETPLTPMRKAIGDKLKASKTFIPHFYVQQTIVVDELMKLREQLKNTGVRLTFNDFIMKACSYALRENPVINSGFNSKEQKIINFETIDICVAVSIDQGLITPMIRFADYKDIGEISSEVRHLATLAKEGKLEPHQYEGGSFTVSNLGMFGIDDFRAVINPPQAAILAVGGILEKPIVTNGKIVAGHTMTVSLSSDHRVVDGADAAKFVKDLKKYLENPVSLVI